MAVWRKWEVKIVDDKGQCHYVDFSVKSTALSFCKAMVRAGMKEVVGYKDGLRSQEFFRKPSPTPSGEA